MEDITKKVSLSTACELAIEQYKIAGKQIQTPAVRKVLESIIRQKVDHVSILKALNGQETTTIEELHIPNPCDVLEILKIITEYETSFSKILSTLVSAQDNDEKKQDVVVLCEASHKFANWTKDHLELLAMFA